MKRGSSVLQPPFDAAKRHTHPAHTHTSVGVGGGVGGDALSPTVSSSEGTPTNSHTAGSSPFPAATSLFSPDVSSKMASDLLIRLSEATQKSQVHPGSHVEAESQPLQALMGVDGGQQDEPGLALSPDGPGASPDPPSLTQTPDVNTSTDTLASDLLRKLAEQQEVTCHSVRVKEEEEPMDVDAAAALMVSDRCHDRPITTEMTSCAQKVENHHMLNVKTEELGLSRNKMADGCPHGLQTEDSFFTGVHHVDPKSTDGVKGPVRVETDVSDVNKMAEELVTKAKMENQFPKANNVELPKKSLLGMKAMEQCSKKEEEHPPEAKMVNQVFLKLKTEEPFATGAKMEVWFSPRTNNADQEFPKVRTAQQGPSLVRMENGFLPGTKMADQVFLKVKTEEQPQLVFGAKMEEQCLRAVLWQDMSVNLASALLHQLSERVGKSNGQLTDGLTPPIRSSSVFKQRGDSRLSSSPLSSQEHVGFSPSSLSPDQNSGFFYRCHVCGFETEGRVLFQGHMTEHRQWEHSSFSLHCCICDHSTNQESEMRSHANTHTQGNSGLEGDLSSPLAVAGATPEHRCRICQRSFPGQQELLLHFQGHRQGNQYRCDRCGHLTRTANKLVEHVRVHTGERPFMCHLCPYSAKRRDSLRLHCKVKHGHVHASVHGATATTDTLGGVHTHRSYAHGDNQRSHKPVQRLHTATPHTQTTAASTSSSSSLPLLPHPSLPGGAGWKDLSPLLPITTLLSLKTRPPSSSVSSSSSTSSKHSFLSYLGLTTS